MCRLLFTQHIAGAVLLDFLLATWLHNTLAMQRFGFLAVDFFNSDNMPPVA